jgi:hypothetical protein
MSYDLYLLRMPPDATEEEIGEAARELAEADFPDTPADPEVEARKRALADTMLAEFPELQEAKFDYLEIARFEGITESEARQRHRRIELVGPEDGARITIDIMDTWASIEMPYGRDEDADADMAELWRYLEVLARAGDFVVFDPQGPNVVHLAAGPDGEGGAESKPKEPKRSRWRIW